MPLNAGSRSPRDISQTPRSLPPRRQLRYRFAFPGGDLEQSEHMRVDDGAPGGRDAVDLSSQVAAIEAAASRGDLDTCLRMVSEALGNNQWVLGGDAPPSDERLRRQARWIAHESQEHGSAFLSVLNEQVELAHLEEPLGSPVWFRADADLVVGRAWRGDVDGAVRCLAGLLDVAEELAEERRMYEPELGSSIEDAAGPPDGESPLQRYAHWLSATDRTFLAVPQFDAIARARTELYGSADPVALKASYDAAIRVAAWDPADAVARLDRLQPEFGQVFADQPEALTAMTKAVEACRQRLITPGP